MRMRFHGPLAAAATLMAFGQSLAGQPGEDWRQAIQKRLLSEYKLTKVTADKSSIVEAGTVVVLKKSNLVLFSASNLLPSGNSYVNGIVKSSFFASAALRANNARKFVAGEKLWLTKITFEPKNDGVVLEFLSDPFDDSRYSGTLKFPFAKGSPAPGPEDFAKTVAQVIVPDDSAAAAPPPAAAASAAPAPAAAPPAAETAPPTPEPAAALPAIEAPLPPPDQPPAPPPTVALGQTKDQVIAIMGQPTKIANLGTKQIYVYKDFKVTLTAGKVTNIE